MRTRLMQTTGSAFLLVGILLDLRGFRAVVNPGMGGSPTLAQQEALANGISDIVNRYKALIEDTVGQP